MIRQWIKQHRCHHNWWPEHTQGWRCRTCGLIR